jgi:T-complex protein 1 subunit beta
MSAAPVFLNPLQILKPDAEQEKGEHARLSSFVGAIAVGDLIKSTLGPKGMDKILVSSDPTRESVQITNDGATILKSLGIDNPAAKILVEIALVQDSEVGDGTTSVTVLASELLKEAERLVAMRMHPQTIIAGWRKACDASRAALLKSAKPTNSDPEKFKSELLNIARTAMGSKIISQHKDFFAKLAVDAVLRLKGTGNLDSLQILKKLGGSMTDSFLDEGFLLEKRAGLNQPKRIEKARVLIANTPMDTDKIKVFGTRVKVDSVAKVAEMEVAEKEKMKDKVKKILSHNINVFINRQLIYNYPEQLFADANVMAIEHADFEGIERLALVLGGEIVSTFDAPESVKLGTCDLIEEVMVGEDTLLRFSGVALGQACTIVIRGATQQILDEADRSLHDVLCVLTTHIKEAKTLCGGGATEMLMACAVQELALKTPGKESLAMESFAKALAQLPTIMADNAGFDSAELVSQLRAGHNQGKTTLGIDMDKGIVADMSSLGVLESYRVKYAMLNSASEAAEMIIRVDDIIKSAPRQRVPDRGHH